MTGMVSDGRTHRDPAPIAVAIPLPMGDVTTPIEAIELAARPG